MTRPWLPIVARKWLLVLLAAALAGMGHAQQPVYEEPPEEDESLTRKTEYSFNPLQAAQEFKVGEFYRKKGNHKAAAGRYLEATKWNPGLAEAYLKLGEAREKLAKAEQQDVEKQLALEAACEAYKKYLELIPDGGKAKSVRKRVAKLEHR